MSENTFKEVLLYGADAVNSVFAIRPQAIRRAWFDEERVKDFTEICKWLAAEKRSYSTGTDADLRGIIGHSRHDGVVVMTERPPIGAPKLSDISAWREANEPVVYVTKTADAHQIASIARIAASMGVKRLLLDDVSADAAFASSAWSESRGAMEHLRLYRVTGPGGFLKLIEDKYHIIGVVREGGRNPDYTTPVRVPGRSPLLLVGGGPGGIDPDLIARCAYLLHVPSRGATPVSLLNTADCVAHFLPWLTAKTKKTPGEGFRTRMKEAKAAKANARAAHAPKKTAQSFKSETSGDAAE